MYIYTYIDINDDYKISAIKYFCFFFLVRNTFFRRKRTKNLSISITSRKLLVRNNVDRINFRFVYRNIAEIEISELGEIVTEHVAKMSMGKLNNEALEISCLAVGQCHVSTAQYLLLILISPVYSC
jgi:hypothetical protein